MLYILKNNFYPLDKKDSENASDDDEKKKRYNYFSNNME